MADDNAQNTQENTNQTGKGDFTPPESQEALDKLIQARVTRATEAVEQRVKKDFEGYVSPDEAEGLRKQIAERDEKLTGFEREAIAADAGLPKGFGARLQGASAEEWRNDASALAGALVANTPAEPTGGEQQPPSPGFQPRELRGVGGGNPSADDSLLSKSPQELVRNVPRL